jgi:hypothetical protein
MKNENKFWMIMLSVISAAILIIVTVTGIKELQEPEVPSSTPVHKGSHLTDEDIVQMQKSVLRIERAISDTQASILRSHVNLLERALADCYSSDHVDCSCPDSLLARPEDEYESGTE